MTQIIISAVMAFAISVGFVWGCEDPQCFSGDDKGDKTEKSWPAECAQYAKNKQGIAWKACVAKYCKSHKDDDRCGTSKSGGSQKQNSGGISEAPAVIKPGGGGVEPGVEDLMGSKKTRTGDVEKPSVDVKKRPLDSSARSTDE